MKSLKVVVIAKACTLILGVVILGIGLYSHFQSAWVKPVNITSDTIRVIKPYKLCESKQLQQFVPAFRDKSCPHISMERYYISIIIICFILSIVGFGAEFLLDLRSTPLKWVDLGCHCISAVLLLVASIVYLISALQIDKISEAMWAIQVDFRTSEKIAAAALTSIQAILYSVVALLIAKA